jgi:hypothetical protein
LRFGKRRGDTELELHDGDIIYIPEIMNIDLGE